MENNRAILFAAATLAVASLTASRDAFGQQSGGNGASGAQIDPTGPGMTGGTAGSAAHTAGPDAGAGAIADTGGMHDAQGVRDAIEQIAAATVSEQGPAALSDRLTEQDKRRIGDQLGQKNPQLDQQLSQLRQAWKEKYHQDFDLRGNRVAFNDSTIRIVPGDISDTARTASSRIDASTPKTGADDASSSNNNAGTRGSAASEQNRTTADSTNDMNRNGGGIPPGGTNGGLSNVDPVSSNAGVNTGTATSSTGTSAASGKPGGLSGTLSSGTAGTGDATASSSSFSPHGMSGTSSGNKPAGTAASVSSNSASTAASASGGNPSAASVAEHPDRADRSEIGNFVTVVIPAQKNLPTVYVPLIRSGTSDDWKLDVPDTLDANHLQDILQRHMKAILDDKQNWPADQNEGYRLVTHHALAALVNADPGVGSSAK